MELQSRKERHEEFVSNLVGGDVLEIYSLSALSTLCFIFSEMIWRKSGKYRILMDFFIGVIPTVLFLTALSDYIHVLLIIVVVGLFGMKLLYNQNHVSERCNDPLFDGNRSVAVSSYRGIGLLTTSICILAVDFHVYPRRFAKTETYGTGGMDIGVGGFAIMLGMVASEARGLVTDFQRCFLKTGVPLLTIGFVRLMTIKGSNYQEHITEYGLHWNFFFTLVFVKIFSTLMLKCFRSSPLLLAIVCTVLHEFLLRMFLTDWILNAPRTNIISANKEGIGSLLGYVSLFFWGLVLGQQIHMDLIENNRKAHRAVLFSIGGICLGFLSMKLFGPVSRCLTNGAYIGWTISASCLVLVILIFGKSFILAQSSEPNDNSQFGCRSQSVLEMYNSASMFFFLMSNLFTGLINIFIDTLLIPNSISLAILVAYQAVLLFLVKAYTEYLS